ncbi:MAG: tetratricopeptide repeat protein [Planctomycetota bacterium]|jgi:hypothetical protein
MLKCRLFLVVTVVVFCASFAFAKNGLSPEEELFSPSVSSVFYEMAYELSHSESMSDSQTRQAIVLLKASLSLDGGTGDVLPDLIKVISQYYESDYSRLVNELLIRYMDESADLEVARQAVQYLLNRLDSREEREKLIAGLAMRVAGKNAAMESEFMSLLGLFVIERTDIQNAASFFVKAYNLNKYNKLAFVKFSELMPGQIGESANLERFRLGLTENPLSMENALAFAQYAQQLQFYDIAAKGYEYCSKLYDYLYPSEPLPNWIYIPWMLSSYNTQRSSHKCLQIAGRIREDGGFDLFVESIAAKAAQKTSDSQKANAILGSIEEKIQQSESDSSLQISNEQGAWFYCFVSPDSDKALAWANRAYSKDPNSLESKALLAYALLMGEQAQLAKPLVTEYKNNQIASLVMAHIQIAEGNKESAIKTLKSAIALEPVSLVARRAKELLTKQGGDYIKPIDPDVVLSALEDSFEQGIVPEFVPIDKIISVRLNLRGNEFAHGQPLEGSVAIRNISSEPLVISDDGLFKGNIRVDVNVTGDINRYIPALFTTRIQPALPVKPDHSLVIPMHLMTGELKDILHNHPQASLQIELTAFIDPVVVQGKVSNRFVDVAPARLTVEHPRLEITIKYLQNRLNSLSTGARGSKVQSAELFAGLLMEQHVMANREPMYKVVHADWMPVMLKSGIRYSIRKSNWVGRIKIMSAMLELPLDYGMIEEVSKNLYDTYWPVRMMTLLLLHRNQADNFQQVIDWVARYDLNEFVREMAIALGAIAPEPEKQETIPDANGPNSVDANQPPPIDTNQPVPSKVTRPTKKEVNERISAD